ncbi:MAG: UDP-N-acetylmuramoyl-tripeptide--D-alanyl-D-alanine ligase [Pseudomonadales bacterium]|nr:UDP-N-acetylmuramoyl-tripeptide--D-alanyl-D-alanine ligase [Pseudomonadales bacterium]
MRLAEAAKAINGELKGTDVAFASVSTDTRTLAKGDLFVALKGPNFNGHTYVKTAEELGASALMVSEKVDSDLPTIIVENTLHGLGALAAAWKSQFDIPTVAVTGSCGKTSVKEMVATIMSLSGETLATKGNYNNEIGVPLTLLSINEKHRYAVIELGANHIGEIAYTVSLVKPNVATITNAGSAHIEGFGSAENVARAKGEIYQGLVANGKAIINFDDKYSEYWQQTASGYEQFGFSLEDQDAAYYGSDISVNSAGQYRFTLNTPRGSIEIQLPILGKHSVLNAITAASVAGLMGAELSQIKSGLESLEAIKGRLYPIDLGDQVVIDDSYNANPVSIKAAAGMLGDLDTVTCMVLGDMAELGAHAPSMHREVGEFVALQGINYLIAKGKHAADYLVGFNQFKGDDQVCVRFDEFAEIVTYLESEKPKTILVKGSRSAGMEQVVQQLCEPKNNEQGVD